MVTDSKENELKTLLLYFKNSFTAKKDFQCNSEKDHHLYHIIWDGYF